MKVIAWEERKRNFYIGLVIMRSHWCFWVFNVCDDQFNYGGYLLSSPTFSFLKLLRLELFFFNRYSISICWFVIYYNLIIIWFFCQLQFLYFTVDKLLYLLSQGCMLHKVKGGGLLYPRTFYLDTENMVLKYSGSEKRLRKKRISCKNLISF